MDSDLGRSIGDPGNVQAGTSLEMKGLTVDLSRFMLLILSQDLVGTIRDHPASDGDKLLPWQ